MNIPLVIFTDLDGTLLDHHGYSFQGAVKALKRLHRFAVPVILVSSKTRAELRKLQEKLELAEPFIAENGGGLFVPTAYAALDIQNLKDLGDYYVRQFGRPYPEIRKVFESLRDKYHIKGFGDMTVDEIVSATGLAREDAILAAQRDFTEPFVNNAEAKLPELEEEVAAHGLKITRGGRFLHLMAAEQDKGHAVAETLQLFQSEWSRKTVSVGLGDAENDIPMLKTVDIPVLIPKPDNSYINFNLPELRRAPYPGSRGWGAAVMEILDHHKKA